MHIQCWDPLFKVFFFSCCFWKWAAHELWNVTCSWSNHGYREQQRDKAAGRFQLSQSSPILTLRIIPVEGEFWMAYLLLVFNRSTERCTEGSIISSPLTALVQFQRVSLRMNRLCSRLVPVRDLRERLVYVCLVFMKHRKENGAKVCCQTQLLQITAVNR